MIVNQSHYIILSNTGYVYKFKDTVDSDYILESDIKKNDLIEIECKLHKYKNGKELCIENPIIPISLLIYKYFVNEDIDLFEGYVEHIDGNIYNNNINNLKYIK